MNLETFLLVSGIIFCVGLYGTLTRRNAIAVLMGIELMFNAVNIAAVAMSRYIVPAGLRDNSVATADEVVQFLLTGQIFAVFIITVAAAEVTLGLAIIIAIYGHKNSVDVTEVNLMKH